MDSFHSQHDLASRNCRTVSVNVNGVVKNVIIPTDSFGDEEDNPLAMYGILPEKTAAGNPTSGAAKSLVGRASNSPSAGSTVSPLAPAAVPDAGTNAAVPAAPAVIPILSKTTSTMAGTVSITTSTGTEQPMILWTGNDGKMYLTGQMGATGQIVSKAPSTTPTSSSQSTIVTTAPRFAFTGSASNTPLMSILLQPSTVNGIPGPRNAITTNAQQKNQPSVMLDAPNSPHASPVVIVNGSGTTTTNNAASVLCGPTPPSTTPLVNHGRVTLNQVGLNAARHVASHQTTPSASIATKNQVRFVPKVVIRDSLGPASIVIPSQSKPAAALGNASTTSTAGAITSIQATNSKILTRVVSNQTQTGVSSNVGTVSVRGAPIVASPQTEAGAPPIPLLVPIIKEALQTGTLSNPSNTVPDPATILRMKDGRMYMMVQGIRPPATPTLTSPKTTHRKVWPGIPNTENKGGTSLVKPVPKTDIIAVTKSRPNSNKLTVMYPSHAKSQERKMVSQEPRLPATTPLDIGPVKTEPCPLETSPPRLIINVDTNAGVDPQSGPPGKASADPSATMQEDDGQMPTLTQEAPFDSAEKESLDNSDGDIVITEFKNKQGRTLVTPAANEMPNLDPVTKMNTPRNEAKVIPATHRNCRQCQVAQGRLCPSRRVGATLKKTTRASSRRLHRGRAHTTQPAETKPCSVILQRLHLGRRRSITADRVLKFYERPQYTGRKSTDPKEQATCGTQQPTECSDPKPSQKYYLVNTSTRSFMVPITPQMSVLVKHIQSGNPVSHQALQTLLRGGVPVPAGMPILPATAAVASPSTVSRPNQPVLSSSTTATASLSKRVSATGEDEAPPAKRARLEETVSPVVSHTDKIQELKDKLKKQQDALSRVRQQREESKRILASFDD